MTTHTTNHQGPQITSRQHVIVERPGGGDIHWEITEFDHGASYMLSAANGMSFQSHFTGEQWRLFKRMIAEEMGDG